MIVWPVLSCNACNTSHLMGIVRTKRVYLRIPSIGECTYTLLLETVQSDVQKFKASWAPSWALSCMYKYLGVIFNPKLCWTLQQTKALTTSAFWSSCVWRLSTLANGISTSGAKQLHNTVVVLRFTYGAEVWFTYLHKPKGANKMKGLVAITNKFCSIQWKVAKAITGSLSSTARDILDVRAYILLIDLLFCKLLFRAALWLCY